MIVNNTASIRTRLMRTSSSWAAVPWRPARVWRQTLAILQRRSHTRSARRRVGRLQPSVRQLYKAPRRRIGEGLYWAERDSALDGAHPVSIPEAKDRHD